jgi:pyrroloquinoline quinone (PQQ) biosynthesis protein C
LSFHDELIASTAFERTALNNVQIIRACLGGEVARTSYVAFLAQAWHHVRHTVPLMRACQAALPERLTWLRHALDEYALEEEGHDAWILADLAACGVDPSEVTSSDPAFETEMMIAYAYDTIARRSPVGFFGMVHVLEGTSVALALSAADQIQGALALPPSALRYLRSHGTLDREHIRHFAALMNRLTDPSDQAAVVHAAKRFYRLYADMFRALPAPERKTSLHFAANGSESAGSITDRTL